MHYMGGSVVTDTLVWGSTFFAIMARAPDPAMVGEERWRALWMQRLQASSPVFETWLRHPTRDSFWKHGSVCEDYGAIDAAVFAVGGWADGYSNAIFRMLANLKCPRLGLIGPWGHKYPHYGVPGPAIGFLQESLRWWDHWLKGTQTGIMDEPMLRAWMQESVPPRSHYDERPGRWVGEASWPSERIEPQTWFLNSDGLGRKAAKAAPRVVASPQTVGSAAGEWCPYGLGGLGPELPSDQREEDGGSLVFDSAALGEPVEMLGAAVLYLEVAADRPNAMAVVRLNDVAPDGASLRVSYGVLNLTHRNGHERARALTPGARVKVRVQLNEIAHIFPAGHRIRVAISTAYWPILWPAPEAVSLTVTTGRSKLELPVRPARGEDAQIRFEAAVTGPRTKRTTHRPGRVQRLLDRDIATGTVTNTVVRDDGVSTIDAIGTTTSFDKRLVYRIREGDPASARAETHMDLRLERGDWRTRIETHTAIACTATAFTIEADLQAFEGERRVYSRSWTREVPRRHV
jgi:predicted acyl esterase